MMPAFMDSMALFMSVIQSFSTASLVRAQCRASHCLLLIVPVKFFDALNSLGVPTVYDQALGAFAGATFIPTSVEPGNQTRADARVSYYDPISTRPNLHILTDQQVTKILMEDVEPGRPSSKDTRDGITWNKIGTIEVL